MQFIRPPGSVAQRVAKIERKLVQPKTCKEVKAQPKTNVDTVASKTDVVHKKRSKRLRRYHKEHKYGLRTLGVYVYKKDKVE